MDKYTVDLDKVLNDFEYSEYSLESGKLNRSVQEEEPNTSFNSNYSVRNDTTVKHSINNVFHSLNEYLSSDITPKRVEIAQKNTKTYVTNEENLSQLFQLKIEKAEDRSLKFPNDFLTELVPESEELLGGKNLSISNDNLLKKTDSDKEFDSDKALKDIPREDSSAEEIGNKNEYNEIDVPETFQVDSNDITFGKEKETEDKLNEKDLDLKDGISEEVLVDLGCNNDNCDKNFNVEIEVKDKNISEHSLSADKIEEKNTLETLNPIPHNNSQDVLLPLTCKESIEKKNKEVKVGFKNDFDLDEEKLDLYFQELEQELGQVSEDKVQLELNEIESSRIEEPPKTESVVHPEVSDEFESGERGVLKLVKSNEETLENNNSLEINRDVDLEPTKETCNEINNTGQLETEGKIKSTEPISFQDETQTLGTIENTHIQTTIEKLKHEHNEDSSVNINIITSIEQSSSTSEKNARPQQLILQEENKETVRKINLVGDPGSTPYNNVYSTKDFEKNDSHKNSSHEDAERAISPTYSDISTDSVSSSSSDEAEYNDAVSELQTVKKNSNGPSLERQNEVEEKIMIQNNMISSVETCRSDITMDKDFKNNLKSSSVEESIEHTSMSNVSEGIVEEISSNLQDPEESTRNVVDECSDDQGETVSNEVTTDSHHLTLDIPAIPQSIGIDWLGKQAPLWIPDNEAMSCLHCDMKFTVIKRRHHCRACGLVLCSKCCNLKCRLEYLETDARVCNKCYEILNRDTNSSSGSEISQEHSSPSRNLNINPDSSGLGQPNPNNPLEYCSTLSPLQQVEPGSVATPSVMVPVGVLKRTGSNKGRSNKSVMFCDGIRPGSDLTNLDKDFNYTDSQKSEKQKKSPEKSVKNSKHFDLLDLDTISFIPFDEKKLPPTVTIFKSDIKYSPCVNNSSVVEILKNEALIFAIQSNFFIHVRIINMDCCVNRTAWCFSTEGLINVGQDELVILLELVETEQEVPKDIFLHLNNIYLEAVKGSSVKDLGLSLHTATPFLGSKNHAGFVYIRPTFQCLQNVIIPKEPYLIGILIHRWETPWAKLFPLRLVLRLGAEYKYYPSPIISTRGRDSVFVEIGHTIINLLADFRNFSFTLPQTRGLTIHMEDKNTTVTIPINRYDQVLKSLNNSSDHILAFAGNFSTSADSHLVCIQDTQGATNNYSTHAINICNQPRKITGASFIVFNGALKSTSGLTAKSNIVEDGLMIQILPEHMLQVRESLRSMKDHIIKCGCVNEESDETVSIIWGEPDTSFNVGVRSPIDNKVMDGIPSIRVHNGKDYACNSKSRLIRWTEVFIVQSGEESSRTQDPVDISKISENVAKATCQALVKYLDLLVSNSFYKIGLRANLHVENVSYLAGSNNVKLPPIYMKSLDNELIPVLHRITSNNITEQPIVLELIFRILNI